MVKKLIKQRNESTKKENQMNDETHKNNNQWKERQLVERDLILKKNKKKEMKEKQEHFTAKETTNKKS